MKRAASHESCCLQRVFAGTIVIESVMFFALGFLAASLIALVLLSAVWQRAVRLTTRRIEGAIPVSMAEIQADKDQLRAEFAMSTRRLENGVEQLKPKTSEQLAEIGRKSEAIRLMKEEVDQKTARATALEAQDRTLRDQLRSTEADLNQKSKARNEAETDLANKSGEIAQAARAIADKSVESDSRRVEIVALETQCVALKDRVSDLEREVASTEERLADEHKLAEQNAHVLGEEREKVPALTRNADEVEGRLAAPRRPCRAPSPPSRPTPAARRNLPPSASASSPPSSPSARPISPPPMRSSVTPA